MEKRNFSTIVFFVALFVSLSLVSAQGFELTKEVDLPNTVSAGNDYSVRVLFNNSNDTYPNVDISFSGTDFVLPNDDNVAFGDTEEYILTLDVPSGANGLYSRTLVVDVMNDSTVVDTLSVVFSSSVSSQTFCEILGMNDGGDLEITEFDITNNGRGSDDEWDLLDDIEIEVTVENTDNDDDIDDVFVELRIFDNNGDDVTNDFELDDEEIDVGRIRDDDEETVTFTIPEIPVDLDEGDYRIYVVAYSDDDASQCISQSNELDRFNNPSTDNYAEIELKKEYDEGIIVKDDELTNIVVSCGQQVQLPLELYNIGDEKEDEVLVTIYNSQLGIDERTLVSDFRSGKRKNIDFVFTIPEDADTRSYTLDIMTYFDWDDDEDEYDIDSYDQNSDDDLDENYGLRLDVESCNANNGGNTNGGSTNDVEPVISARLLDSDNVNVGSEVVILATLSNPSSETTSFVVSARNYQSWSTLTSLEPSVVTLAPGQEETVEIVLVPTESGLKTFELKLQNSAIDVSQDISLNVDSQNTVFTGQSVFGDLFSGDTGNIVVVILIVLIVALIIVIFIVAIRRS